MKKRPLYENLDTSFVDLAGLIKYLRRRELDAHIRVELIDYEADIYLAAESGLTVCERERFAENVVEGKEALRRILLRVRAPGGVINVYPIDAENEIDGQISAPARWKSDAAESAPPAPGEASPVSRIQSEEREAAAPPIFSSANLARELRGKVKTAAPRQSLSPEEWRTMLALTGEILATIESALSDANLDFSTAFQKARAEIAADYPFLTALEYRNGQIKIIAPRSPRIFVAGVLEAVRLILEQLARSPEFSDIYRSAAQKIIALRHEHDSLYDRFFITPPLKKMLGI